MIGRIFNSQAKSVTFAAILLALSALVSRILGLVRDRLLAGSFGAGEELDVYFAAFRIPDLVYGILVMGGISAVFLPIFSEYFSKKQEEAWAFVNSILNCLLVLLIAVCGALALLAPFLIQFIAPGFGPEQKELAVSLTRIMFLSPVFLGLSSIFSGVLHYFNRFLAYSFAPVLYNLSIIFGIVFLYPIFGLAGLAYGVIAGAFLHWLSQYPAAKNSGFRYLPVFNFRYPGLKKAFFLMLPRSFGAAIYQLNLIVVTAVASTLAVGSISIYNFAENLQYFPIGIIGVSFAVASFPTLSRAWVNGQREVYVKNFSLTFRQILFFIIPVSFLIFLLRTQIITLILGTGEFGQTEVRLTAACLGVFCLAMFAVAFIPFLIRSFFSLQDTKTPFFTGALAMALNISLAFSLTALLSFPNVFRELTASILNLKGIENIAVVGLPMAVALAAVFQVFLLLLLLRKKIGDIALREILESGRKIFLASLIMASAVFFVLYLAAGLAGSGTFSGLLIQTVLAASAGAIVYFLISFYFKFSELRTIKSSILSQFKKN